VRLPKKVTAVEGEGVPAGAE